ncbi:hypothetical protein YTPLAS18_14400 [Nitrospira sp.]|nr:hypothetical protein YTPLAS18_14400 [Nitrospira sp.]
MTGNYPSKRQGIVHGESAVTGLAGVTTFRARSIGRAAGLAGALWILCVAVALAQPSSDPRHGGDSGGGMPWEGAASIQAFATVGENEIYAGSFGAGMFRSEDRGSQWTAANEGLTDPFILSMAVGGDNTIYAGTFRGGVFRLLPGQQAWEPVNGGLKRLEVKALYVSRGILYAGTGDGVYQLKEGDTRWVTVTSGLDDTLVHAVGQSDDGTLFAGTSGKGVQRYRKRIPGWSRLRQGLKDHEGLIENYIRVVTIGEQRGVYVGTFDGGVFYSSDQGETWRPISRALPNDSIRGIVWSPTRLIVATGRGIFQTQNNGQKWAPLNKGLTELSIQALAMTDKGTLYAGTNGGAFRSDDSGATWVQINDGLRVHAEVPFTFQ